MRASRRDFLAGAGATLAIPLLPRPIFAASPTGTPLHGLSAFGDLKYPADFKHFDYVNPDAPKGGLFSFSVPNWLYNQNPQTFNTLNSFVARGDAPPRMEMCFDSLMTNKSTTALDEPDAVYGLLAESVIISADRNSFEFLLRSEARFHDGSPLTAEDAAFTYKLFKEDGHPSLLLVLTEMTDAVALDRHRLRLSFSGKHSERTILDAVIFPILSKAYYTENSFKSGDLKPPLGSGPYKVGRISPGQIIEYERVADYWGKDLPVNRGAYNFDRIRIDFYLNRQAGFEAFKKGDVLYRQEFTARVWATDYNFPALTQGRVVRREFPGEKRPSMQAVAINLRRERFQDVRVRQAINMCFDFHWTKRNLFYDSYERSQSSFERSDYKAEGIPSTQELALLEPLRQQLPPEVFGEAVMQPISNASGRDRKLLGAAAKLLAEAGWKRDGDVLVNAGGERFALEFLDDDDSLLRTIAPWIENLKAIGVDASMRIIDAAQMQARQADFDFDLVMMALSWDATPTEDGLATAFHSRAAKLTGSRNLPGTADPAVDALIAAVGRAADRQSHVIAMRALDRVLRARRDWIPCWYSANHRAAFWDVFGFKEPKPDYGFPVEAMWWFDKDKAAAIGKA
ncbi:extracellular solute-binding protein [Mesorhizobium sp. LHD-90]|uniref:extracellular solute-binding protein n=1 Tax=Mesorhizobium sp. LHD-90 TaxID=3071414 RepID=UPI0027DF11F0|nr:extracellular solute-binding protein [Mesorhizobium sp. LHD-90]MDQ6435749.1 extracellular solute-binding protein [Mesorhizobium sp. LHD-90]